MTNPSGRSRNRRGQSAPTKENILKLAELVWSGYDDAGKCAEEVQADLGLHFDTDDNIMLAPDADLIGLQKALTRFGQEIGVLKHSTPADDSAKDKGASTPSDADYPKWVRRLNGWLNPTGNE